jgi:hypothetical protein
MNQAIDSVFRKTAPSSSTGTRPVRPRSAIARGRRKDDLAFIVIAALLSALFLAQLGYLILGRSLL